MMVERPEVGQLYWCICPSWESQAYADYAARVPWRGKLKVSAQGVLELSAVDDAGVPDEDQNATAPVKPDELFPDEAAAVAAYELAVAGEWAALADALIRDLPYAAADSLVALANALVGELMRRAGGGPTGRAADTRWELRD